MNKTFFLHYASIIAAGLGLLWSAGCIITGLVVTSGKTGYDSWDLLAYLGLSTLGLAIFLVGVLIGTSLLIMNRFRGLTVPRKPLWIGIGLNIFLAAALVFCLSRA